MKQHLETAGKHIRRSPYQALGAILVLFLTFFIASVATLATIGTHVILHYFETRPQVIAYLKDDVPADQVDALRAKLAQDEKIKEVKYVSKEEALAFYREQNKVDPLLLEMVTANILPASLEISTVDISYLKDLADFLQKEPAVEEVDFQEDIVKTLRNWTTILRTFSFALVGILIVVSILVVLVILGMKMAVRHEEIEILRLLGASSWYITAPFLFEGVFYGIVGAFFGWMAAYLCLLYLTPTLSQFFAGIPLFPVPWVLILGLLAGEIVFGIIMGITASLLAVKRYLK